MEIDVGMKSNQAFFYGCIFLYGVYSSKHFNQHGVQMCVFSNVLYLAMATMAIKFYLGIYFGGKSRARFFGNCNSEICQNNSLNTI